MLGRVRPSSFSPPLRKKLTVAQFHAYEGYPLDTVVYPIRLMAALGVQDVISASHLFTDFPSLSSSVLVLTNEAIVTNAAGSLKADVPVGTSAFYPAAWQSPTYPSPT
jgi:purine-nucleoside phosphorylase